MIEDDDERLFETLSVPKNASEKDFRLCVVKELNIRRTRYDA